MTGELSTLEKRWDRLWPLACRVAHAVERYDGLDRDDDAPRVALYGSRIALLLDVVDAARALSRVVDELSPEESDR